MRFGTPTLGLGLAVIWGLPSVAFAADLPATPDNYYAVLGQLQPGDAMVLAPGTYTRLTIDGVHGTEDAWITIRGPARGDPAVVVGESGSNTVQLYDSSYVAVESLTVDVQGLLVDAINAKDSISHHIRIEGNTLQGFPAGEQQIVGVNTKSTAFGWTIRGNTIIEAGTGMYLGNSDGNAPFIDGRIENNLIIDPVGYCMQIKHQNPYDAPAGLTAGPHTTVIRHNVFIKDDRPSPDGVRPNLLVGGFPTSGPGTDDLYDIYGNFIHYNPNESLFQGTGRMSLHDNIFVGSGGGTAVLLTSHQGHDVLYAAVYNNTIYGVGTGVSLSGGAQQSSAAVGNLIFADQAIGGSFDVEQDNLTAAVGEATSYVTAPSLDLATMDFYPLVGTVTGAPLDLSAFAQDEAYDLDYNGMSKGDLTFRGAYAGEGDNPGCALAASIKDCVPPGGGTGSESGGDSDSDSDSDGGSVGGGGTSSSDGGATTADSAGSSGEDGDSGGCGCTRAPGESASLWMLVLAAGSIRRRLARR